MPKYTVGITVNAPIATVVEIEADNEEQAEERARAEVLTDYRYHVRDFNGNAVDVVDDDLFIDSIDDGAPGLPCNGRNTPERVGECQAHGDVPCPR